MQSGSLTHITVYTEYMGVSEANGRYLIAIYSLGQLIARMLINMAPKSVRAVTTSTSFMMRWLFCTPVCLSALLAIWYFIPADFKLLTLYLVFPLMGGTIAWLLPFSYALVESITPVTGRISCIFWLIFGVGDFLIVFVNGKLIQILTPNIQPVSIAIICVTFVPILTLTIYLHRQYLSLESQIINLEAKATAAKDTKDTMDTAQVEETEVVGVPSMNDGYSNSCSAYSVQSTTASVVYNTETEIEKESV